jgi:hypothetical protein
VKIIRLRKGWEWQASPEDAGHHARLAFQLCREHRRRTEGRSCGSRPDCGAAPRRGTSTR